MLRMARVAAIGWAHLAVNRGIVTKNCYDEQGNVTKTIDNYQGDGTPSADEPDVNQTTEDTYNSDNQLVDQTAVDPGGVNQTTENVYGTSGADNDKGLLVHVEYPDPTTGEASSANEVTYTYNSDGSVATMTDRDGTVHSYEYDDDGNQIADVITTLGAGVDGTVMQRDTTFNDQGQPVDYTTENAAGDVLSQVQETYDGNDKVIAEAQSHDGAVTEDTPTVGYGYQETTGGQERQTSLTYPDGREIDLSYGDTGSLTDAEGWVYGIADANSLGEDTLATFGYMGDGTMVGQDRPQTGANEAITLDNFGDIADLNWTNSADTSTDHFGLGYDADGNVMYKENYVLPSDSELYHANGATPGYDGLNRLTTFSRGTLSASVDGGTLDTISSPSFTQSWTLDAVGNQTAVTTNGTTQSKTQNGQNQTTSVGGASLNYDGNGATTYDEDGRIWTYDAWGDPVSVSNSDGEPMETEAYDALGRRITDTTYDDGTPSTTDLYYSTAGQVLEEDKSGSVVSQTVYSAGYVNSIIEVDQATGSPGTLNLRLYVQQDANYNVTSVTDTSGTVLERYIYSPYGQQTVLNPDGTVKGDGTPASSSYNLPNGYQGMLFDPVLSDNLTPNRVYDPMLGTWTSEDPSGASGSSNNLYQSFSGAPITASDPSGLAPTTAPTERPAAAPAASQPSNEYFRRTVATPAVLPGQSGRIPGVGTVKIWTNAYIARGENSVPGNSGIWIQFNPSKPCNYKWYQWVTVQLYNRGASGSWVPKNGVVIDGFGAGAKTYSMVSGQTYVDPNPWGKSTPDYSGYVDPTPDGGQFMWDGPTAHAILDQEQVGLVLKQVRLPPKF